VDEDLDYLNSKYIGTEYGNLRRERAQLQRQLILNNDASVKPRIREITAELHTMLAARKINA
jgi:hypothetical protein